MDRKMSEQKLNIEFVKEVENFPCIYDYRRPDYARKEIIDKAWVKIGMKFNLSGPQCRERWKNLRTVLSRNLRPNEQVQQQQQPNGRSRSSKQQRKPYYLFEAMKFAVPFIKSHNTVPAYYRTKEVSNSASDQDDKSVDTEENEEIIPEPICQVKVENVNYEQSRSPSPQYASPPPSPQVNIMEATSPLPVTLLQPGAKRKRRTRAQSTDSADVEADENGPKNAKTKKTKNQIKGKVDLTKVSKKRFLLSLLSDVYSMDNTQMRSFRIKVLNLINEITQTPGAICQCMAAASNFGPGQLFQSQTPSQQSVQANPNQPLSRDLEQTRENENSVNVTFPTVLVKIEKEDE